MNSQSQSTFSLSQQGVFWIRIAAALGFLGVCMGTFMAHGLEGMLKSMDITDPSVLEKRKEWLQTGVEYHMYHTLAILGVGAIALAFPYRSKSLDWSGWLFLIGVLLFPGSLFALSLTGYTKLGMIAPIGGVSFLLGWLMLIFACGSPRNSS